MSSRYQAGIVLPGYNALKVANAPTIGTATAGSSGCVSVTFTAPSCVGGGAISSYTVFACCGVKLTSGASSPLVVTGLTVGQAYTFKTIATNAYGPSYPSASSNSATPVSVGQQAYTTAGTYSWVAPAGVTSVSVVTVGASTYSPGSGYGGAGAGLGYKNNYAVTPGNSYSVKVGTPDSSTANMTSYFVSCAVVAGKGPTISAGSSYTIGGTYVGDGGGAGGNVASAGGGGAGGYSGAGGASRCATQTGNPGTGGGGGSSGYVFQSYTGGGGGGGVGILGQGANGAGGTTSNSQPGYSYTGGGGGGSGGGAGGSGQVYKNCCGTPSCYSSSSALGGDYGGGGGRNNCFSNITVGGGKGAVRIIWPGTTRSFPSTNTGDL